MRGTERVCIIISLEFFLFGLFCKNSCQRWMFSEPTLFRPGNTKCIMRWLLVHHRGLQLFLIIQMYYMMNFMFGLLEISSLDTSTRAANDDALKKLPNRKCFGNGTNGGKYTCIQRNRKLIDGSSCTSYSGLIMIVDKMLKWWLPNSAFPVKLYYYSMEYFMSALCHPVILYSFIIDAEKAVAALWACVMTLGNDVDGFFSCVWHTLTNTWLHARKHRKL